MSFSKFTQLKLSADKELILRLQKDDATAFDELYWSFHSGLYANVFKLTRDKAAAEEVVQETFISLWEKRHALDSKRGIAGWLFVVSYNYSVSHLRKVVKEAAHQHALSGIDLEVESSRDIETQWIILEEAVQQLSPQKRKVFELCKLQGKTYEQTAFEMGISRHTVKEYLSDAVALIKKYVQQNQGQHAFLLAAALLGNFLF